MRLTLAIVVAINVGFILWRVWASGLLRVEPCSAETVAPRSGRIVAPSAGTSSVTITNELSECLMYRVMTSNIAIHQPYDAGASLILVDNQGRLVYSKQTNAIHNAFKDMCKDYFGKKGK